MIKLFVYNNEDRMSQIAYGALMRAGVDIRALEVTGQNVANRLKRVGITQIPTLYLRDKRNSKMLVGQEILDFLEQEEEQEEDVVPIYHKSIQTQAPRRPKKSKRREESEESELSNSEINSDDEEVSELDMNSEIDSGSEQDSNEPLENEKGKLNPKAVMRMMSQQNPDIGD